MVLGGRHLVGFFFLLVVVLGVVFTLGYLLGRSQYDTSLRAAVSNVVPPAPAGKNSVQKPAKSSQPDNSANSEDDDNSDEPVNSANSRAAKSLSASAKNGDTPAPQSTADWDFYHSADPAKTNEKLSPPPPPSKKPQVITASNRIVANGGVTAANSPTGGRALNSPLIPRNSIVLQVAALARQADALSLAQALQQKKFPAYVLPPDADHYYRVQVGPYTDAKAANTARQRLDKAGFKYIVKR
jgi:cell division septation protein DedD